MNSRQEEIEKLLERFYAASLSSEEMQSLYTYFLYTNPLPDKFKDEVPLLQELGIRYFCQQDSAALESKIDQWYEEENTTTRFVKIVSLSRAAMKRIAAAAACVAAIAIGFWAISTNVVPTMPTYDMLQPTQVAQAEVPAKQQTLEISTTAPTYPATTDNEIKNTANQTADRHNYTMLAANQTATLPTADAPQPDIIATAPIEQEHIPVLLAETETQIEIEQNLVAEENNDNISTSPVYTSELLAFDNTDINNIDNEQYWQLAEFDTFCNTRCTDMQVVETITRTLI